MVIEPSLAGRIVKRRDEDYERTDKNYSSFSYGTIHRVQPIKENISSFSREVK
jgi:hypothetical protein